jgi:hypothetical protein
MKIEDEPRRPTRAPGSTGTVPTGDQQEITAWRARDAPARYSVNFRNFCVSMHSARAARARGFDSLPSLWDVATLSKSMNNPLLILLLDLRE